ncbi:Arm DNA-binding domain-containing protein [Desulfovibrio sp. SGI.169]|uniref:Arm DNA-binding domain-containing protein n=1 Tax=Desulfovibrio sp. SGI.169 TaxID=3420561 RepID=UPI003D068007
MFLKSWRLAYRFAGRQKLISLGPYPSVSPREAREKREDAKKLREHIDPSQARRQGGTDEDEANSYRAALASGPGDFSGE